MLKVELKTFKCPFCTKKYVTENGKKSLYHHMTLQHYDELGGLPAAQVFFNYKNKYNLHKGNGRSIISGKPTKFNLKTERYELFLPEEKDQYVALFRKRMLAKYGKENLLNEPEQQKIMLKNRNISGEYKWSDGGTTSYAGSYELEFLKFLDSEGFTSDSILSPAPQIFPYLDEDDIQRFHIPDFYIPSINLIVQIKASDNNHYRLRDLHKELACDQAIVKSNRYNYVKIFDKKHRGFLDLVDEIVYNLSMGNTTPIIRELK